MLKVENVGLRQRNKALQETVASLTMRNTQLVTEKERLVLDAVCASGLYLFSVFLSLGVEIKLIINCHKWSSIYDVHSETGGGQANVDTCGWGPVDVRPMWTSTLGKKPVARRRHSSFPYKSQSFLPHFVFRCHF